METHLDNKRSKSPLFENGDMSKDFGLDITAFHGGLVKSAASQKQYHAVCSDIYDQFTRAFSEHINEESSLRRHIRRSSRHNRNHGAASAPGSMPVNVTYNARAGCDLDSDEDTEGAGTSKFGRLLDTTSKEKQETPGIDSRNHCKKPELSFGTVANPYKEYDGRIETSSTNISKNRLIRVNAKTFSRLTKGQIRVQLLNTAEDYILTPFPGEKHVNNERERLAVAKQRTTYQTPTLASELKVNNLVAIQRDIQGQESRRRSVRNVLNNARDRRARVFRVQLTNYKFCDDLQFNDDAGRTEAIGGQTAFKQTLQRKQHWQRLRPRHFNSESASGLSSCNPTPPDVDAESVDTSNESESLDHYGGLTSEKSRGLSKYVENVKSFLSPDTDESSYIAIEPSKPLLFNELHKINTENAISIKKKRDIATLSNKENPECVATLKKESPDRCWVSLNKNPERTKISTKVNPSLLTPNLSVAKYKPVRSAPPPGPTANVKSATTLGPTADVKSDPTPGPTSNVKSAPTLGPTADVKSAPTPDPTANVKSAPPPGPTADEPLTNVCNLKPVHTMHDVMAVVKQWKEEDRAREQRLNLWRKRMAFATSRSRAMSGTVPRR